MSLVSPYKDIVQYTKIKIWIPYVLIGVPFLIGMVFTPKVCLGFSLGSVFIGFFFATSTTLTSGLLESSKEWCLCTFTIGLVHSF